MTMHARIVMKVEEVIRSLVRQRQWERFWPSMFAEVAPPAAAAEALFELVRQQKLVARVRIFTEGGREIWNGPFETLERDRHVHHDWMDLTTPADPPDADAALEFKLSADFQQLLAGGDPGPKAPTRTA
jgi:hypothetical protein